MMISSLCQSIHSMGSHIRDFCGDIAKAFADQVLQPLFWPSGAKISEAAKAEAVWLSCRSLGRLLQVQHTLLSLARLHEEHYDPEACAAAAAELACTCGIASEYSSLLKLSMAEQEP